jgi:HSP20 family protein
MPTALIMRPEQCPSIEDESSFEEAVVNYLENDPIIREIKAMKRRMDVLYDQSLNEEVRIEESQPFAGQSWAPPMDVWETDDLWVLSADLPGVRDENLTVQVSDGVLNISGNRVLPELPAHATVQASERQSGRFQRSFGLPRDARQDRVEAELAGGVLTIRVQRKAGEPGISRKIPVQSE